MERNGAIVQSSPTEPREKSMILFLLDSKMIQILLKKTQIQMKFPSFSSHSSS